MVAQKISALPALGEAPVDADLLAMVDVSATATKKMTMAELALYIASKNSPPNIILQDQKATGVGGGSSSAGMQTRVLNTEVRDVNGDSSLSANQFTLTAGDYYAKFNGNSYRGDGSKVFIFNTTGAVNLVIGQAMGSANGDGYQSIDGDGVFTVAASQALELRHYFQTAKASNGLGVATSDGTIEIYSQVSLWGPF